MRFKFLKHTADVKFQAFGDSKEEVFANSALALKECICGKEKIKLEHKKNISCSGKDLESLLYKFLEEIIYFLEGEEFIVGKLEKLKIDGMKLTAEATGDNSSQYHFTNKVKAVTYSDMFIKKNKKKWTAQVVLDV